MRLIDADAYCAFLREVSTRQHYETLLTKKDKYPTVADVIEEICCDLDGTSLNGFDNAPTVDPEYKLVPIAKLTFDEDKLKEIVQTEVIDKIKSGELVLKTEEQSKGKWIHDPLHNTVCSVCGGIRRDSRFDHVSYCNKCGAKMEEE